MPAPAPLRVVVAGLGNMGRSHALAYARNPGFEVAALVNRSDVALPPELAGMAIGRSFTDAIRDEKPDVAAIATYSDSHADYAVAAFEAGCHVFVEKPLATTVADAQRVVDAAKANGRKLVVGYILRHHPSWMRLIAEARKLGVVAQLPEDPGRAATTVAPPPGQGLSGVGVDQALHGRHPSIEGSDHQKSPLLSWFPKCPPVKGLWNQMKSEWV